MNEFRSWALSLTIGIVVASVAAAVAPSGSMNKTVRIAAALFAVSVVCAPLKKLNDFHISSPVFSDEGEDIPDDASEKLKIGLADVCKEAAENEILSAAKELGIEVASIEAELDIDDDNCVIINKIAIFARGCSDAAAEELSRKAGERLGTPVSVETE